MNKKKWWPLFWLLWMNPIVLSSTTIHEMWRIFRLPKNQTLISWKYIRVVFKSFSMQKFSFTLQLDEVTQQHQLLPASPFRPASCIHRVMGCRTAEGTSGCDGARDMILNSQTPWQPGSNAVDSATWLNCMRSWREGAKTCCWREETQAAVAGSKACAGYRLCYDTRWGIAGDSNEENIIPKSSSPCHQCSFFFLSLMHNHEGACLVSEIESAVINIFKW